MKITTKTRKIREDMEEKHKQLLLDKQKKKNSTSKDA